MKSKFLVGIKYLFQLGASPLALYALYKFGLLTGHYKRVNAALNVERLTFNMLFPLPSREQLNQTLGEEGRAALLKEADEIINGQVCILDKSASLANSLHLTSPTRNPSATGRNTKRTLNV